MNKGLKKGLVFGAVLLLVILVIVVIELVIPTKKTNEQAAVSATTSLTPSSAVTVVSPSATPATVTPSVSPSASDPAMSTEETAAGTKYTVTLPDGLVQYSITVDKKAFIHSKENGSDVFTTPGNKNEYIRISFLPNVKAATIAPSFLTSVLDFKNFEQSGKNPITGTKISGETVTADDGKTQVTAWLVNLDSGVMAVVISLELSQKETQQAQLDAVLTTMTLKR